MPDFSVTSIERTNTPPLPILARVEYPQHVQVAAGDLVTNLVLADQHPADFPVAETGQALTEPGLARDAPDTHDDRLNGPRCGGHVHGLQELVDPTDVRDCGPGPPERHGLAAALATSPCHRQARSPGFHLGMRDNVSGLDLVERRARLAIAVLRQADICLDGFLDQPAPRPIESVRKAVKFSSELRWQMSSHDAGGHGSIQVNQID